MRTTNAPVRTGFTLFELLIVLAIIVLVASFSVPVIRSMLSDGRLSAAADQVRAQIAETRSRAMDDGRPWKLAYLPNTGVYQFAPEESSAWDDRTAEPMLKTDMVRDLLPTDIVFGKTEQEILGGTEGGGGGADWETIAIYLPGGDARDDTMTYFGQLGFMPMRVQVRALTGAVDVQQSNQNQEGRP